MSDRFITIWNAKLKSDIPDSKSTMKILEKSYRLSEFYRL